MTLKKTKDENNYEDIYKKNGEYVLELSKGLSLLEILIKIQCDKEYIYNFIKQEKIQEIIKSIKNSYRFNRYEIEDIITVVTTEYFFRIQIDINNFDEVKFLEDFKKEIVNRTQKEVRTNYSAKDIPLSGSDFYENAIWEDCLDYINNKVDLKNAIDKLSLKEKQVLKLYYIDEYNQQEIAQQINLSQRHISNILTIAKNIIKDNF
jgi:RNA polymerase sigma factor (sigma-70 family)